MERRQGSGAVAFYAFLNLLSPVVLGHVSASHTETSVPDGCQAPRSEYLELEKWLTLCRGSGLERAGGPNQGGPCGLWLAAQPLRLECHRGPFCPAPGVALVWGLARLDGSLS